VKKKTAQESATATTSDPSMRATTAKPRLVLNRSLLRRLTSSELSIVVAGGETTATAPAGSEPGSPSCEPHTD